MKKQRIALLSGGISPEREVSLNSGDQVYEALDKEKYDIIRYDPKFDLNRLVTDAPKIDAALIILHGAYGEDGTVQGLLELLNIPYQGSGVLASAMAMDKLVSKKMYEKAGLPVPPYITINVNDDFDSSEVLRRLGLPLVVKPVKGGSSIGMSIVESEDMLENALELGFKHDNVLVLEAYIDGMEITAGIIGNETLQALPLIEIVPDKSYRFFDYEAKYTKGATQEICPARIDEPLTQKAQMYAQTAHNALFCNGYSRTDIILKDQDLYVLETNTIPGMTATSLLPQAAEAAGISFSQLMDKLIKLGIESHSKKNNIIEYRKTCDNE